MPRVSTRIADTSIVRTITRIPIHRLSQRAVSASAVSRVPRRRAARAKLTNRIRFAPASVDRPPLPRISAHLALALVTFAGRCVGRHARAATRRLSRLLSRLLPRFRSRAGLAEAFNAIAVIRVLLRSRARIAEALLAVAVGGMYLRRVRAGIAQAVQAVAVWETGGLGNRASGADEILSRELRVYEFGDQVVWVVTLAA